MTGPVDIKDLVAALNDRLPELCAELMPAGRREGGEYVEASTARGGRGDALKVCLRGAKRGVFKHFASGEGGDALDLIAYCLELDKRAAYRWARGWLGWETVDENERAEIRRKAARRAAEAEAQQRQQADAYKRKARALWLKGAREILGTPVDDYLRQARGIDVRRLARPPSALRYLDACYCGELGDFRDPTSFVPAMLANVSADGPQVATHRTWLGEVIDADGVVTWDKRPGIRKPRKVYGPMGGGTIRLQRGASGKPLADCPADDLVYVTEGIEDALATALIVPEARVMAAISVGNMGDVWLPPQLRRVVLVGDNDAKPEPVEGLRRSVARLRARGFEVGLYRPPAGIKDMNDLWRSRLAEAG